MNAIVLAGGSLSPGDPLRAHLDLGVPANKAFLQLGDKPILQWVLDAVGGSRSIGEVAVIGRNADEGWQCMKPLHFLPDQGSLTGNIRAGLAFASDHFPNASQTVVVSGDIPLIQPEMIEWVVTSSQALNADLVYHVITQGDMEKRFPTSHRTYVSLRDLKICGGDLNVVANRVAETHADLFDRLAEARKSPIRQASIFGLGVLLGVLLRRYDLVGLAHTLGERLELNAQAVICPYPELGMDIDKMEQYELAVRELTR